MSLCNACFNRPGPTCPLSKRRTYPTCLLDGRRASNIWDTVLGIAVWERLDDQRSTCRLEGQSRIDEKELVVAIGQRGDSLRL